MNNMHKLDQSTTVSSTPVRQARHRKVHAWLRVTASLSEQVAAELRDISGLQRSTSPLDIDLERAMALAERLTANSSIMHDTLGTLFDSLGESEDDLSSEEDTVMGDQDGTLGEDMASVKRDLTDVKADLSVVKEDVAGLKVDVAGLKKDVGELKVDVTHLKTDVSSLQMDMAVVKSNYATRSDVAEAKSAVILSCVGTMIALSSLVFAVAKLVH